MSTLGQLTFRFSVPVPSSRKHRCRVWTSLRRDAGAGALARPRGAGFLLHEGGLRWRGPLSYWLHDDLGELPRLPRSSSSSSLLTPLVRSILAGQLPPALS